METDTDESAYYRENIRCFVDPSGVNRYPELVKEVSLCVIFLFIYDRDKKRESLSEAFSFFI